MPSAQLLAMADFYAALAARWPANDVPMQRDLAERLHMLASEPEGVTYAEVDAGGVPALWAIPLNASSDHVLLHSHSGGSVVSSMYMDRKAVGHLAKATGARALITNFRLAPEHKFPAQIDDVEAAFDWLVAKGYAPSRIASVGHSIGGNYAVNLALTLLRKGKPTPAAIVSMSPWFDVAVEHVAVETHGHLDKQITRDQLLGFAALMLDGTGVRNTDSRINLLTADPVGLPPTLIYYGDHEILSGDAIAFADRARAAGVEIDLRVLAHGQHNFILGAGRVPEIDAAVLEMATWLRVKLGLTA
jgi:monoterpene epsilon-lactone hydrolase